MRTQNYLRLSYLQKYLKKQYDVVFISDKVIITYSKKREQLEKKLTHSNPAKNDGLVKAKKS